MHWMPWKGWALAGALAVAAAPAFAAPQDPKPAPSVTPPAAAPAPPPAAAPAAPPAVAPEARRISADEVRQALAKGKAVLVDVRSKDSYDASHAQGAISIPLGEIESRAGELPKDKLVVTYCT
jgi:Rhodanese-like domain